MSRALLGGFVVVVATRGLGLRCADATGCVVGSGTLDAIAGGAALKELGFVVLISVTCDIAVYIETTTALRNHIKTTVIVQITEHNVSGRTCVGPERVQRGSR